MVDHMSGDTIKHTVPMTPWGMDADSYYLDFFQVDPQQPGQATELWLGHHIADEGDVIIGCFSPEHGGFRVDPARHHIANTIALKAISSAMPHADVARPPGIHQRIAAYAEEIAGQIDDWERVSMTVDGITVPVPCWSFAGTTVAVVEFDERPPLAVMSYGVDLDEMPISAVESTERYGFDVRDGVARDNLRPRQHVDPPADFHTDFDALLR